MYYIAACCDSLSATLCNTQPNSSLFSHPLWCDKILFLRHLTCIYSREGSRDAEDPGVERAASSEADSRLQVKHIQMLVLICRRVPQVRAKGEIENAGDTYKTTHSVGTTAVVVVVGVHVVVLSITDSIHTLLLPPPCRWMDREGGGRVVFKQQVADNLQVTRRGARAFRAGRKRETESVQPPTHVRFNGNDRSINAQGASRRIYCLGCDSFRRRRATTIISTKLG